MAADKNFRTLTALRGASSSRVLNLNGIALAQAANPGHRSAPFFASPALNSSIILKHRLRTEEKGLFSVVRASATKVIIPFQMNDLSVGGRSFFVGEKHCENIIRGIIQYKNDGDFRQDMDVLSVIDAVPSLDPFLLREHFARNGYKPDPCYFTLSDADQARIFNYAADEVRRLTSMAVGNSHAGAANKMASALLANEISEILEPLRQTLNLNSSEFSEGIFAWRGFLYYKWSFEDLWPALLVVLRSFDSIRIKGSIGHQSITHIEKIRRAIKVEAIRNAERIRSTTKIYDETFSRLTDHQDPAAFRDFLLSAPSLFVDIGERIAALSHITSFWRYRFPSIESKAADEEELITLFSDFAQSMGVVSVAA